MASDKDGTIGPPNHRSVVTLLCMFLGDDILAWLVLALGGALAVGNLLALVKPPASARAENDLAKAPVARTLLMGLVGLVAAMWAIASLLGG